MSTLNTEERHLIIIQGLDFFAYQLSSVFVTVFLFTNSDLKTTFLYRTITFISLLFFYVLSGWTLRKISSGNHMRIGLAGAAVYYLLLFLLQGKVINYLIPLAIYDGLIGGIYWSAFNLNQYIFTDKTNRERFFGIINAMINFLSALGPAIGGAIITVVGTGAMFGIQKGYAALFFLVFLLLALTTLFIGKLPSHEVPQFRYMHLITHKRSRAWWIVLWQQAVWGLSDMTVATITGVLFYLILKQELLLGVYQSVGYFMAAAIGLLAGKLLAKHHAYFWIGVIGCTISNSILALSHTPTGLWLYIIISGLTAPFLFTLVSTIGLQTIDRSVHHWTNAYHFLLERDIAMGLARIVSFFLLFLFVSESNQLAIVNTFLYVLPIIPITLGLLVWQSEHLSSTSL